MNALELDAIVQQAFGLSIAAKGKAYWRQGHVLKIKTEKVSGIDQNWVDGIVRGKQRLPYECGLDFPGTRLDRMTGSCACPMEFNCKHCAALAYAWLSQFLRTDPPRSLDGWLEQLKGQPPAEPYPSEQAEALLYILSLDERQAFISLLKRRRQHKGYDEIHPEPLKHLVGSFSRYPDQEQEIGRLLLSQAELGNDWGNSETVRLQGDAGKLALARILTSGDCHYQDPEGIPLLAGEPRPLSFDWKKTSEGWLLQPQATPPANKVFLVGGAWYLDKVLQCVGPLNSEIPPELLRHLLNAPPVPASQLEEVATVLMEALPTVHLPLPEGLRIEIETVSGVEPTAQLTLRGMPREGRDPLYIAELEFDYDGVFLSPTTEVESLRLEQDGVFYQLQRDLAAEAAWRAQLPKTGLVALGDGMTFVLPGDSGHAQAQAWEQWLREAYPSLEDRGWTIHVGSDFGLSVYAGEGEWQAKVESPPQADWFELSLGIEVDGQPLNLMPMLLTLLQQMPDPHELQDLLARKDSLLLPVAAEHWIRVPSARLKGILATLLELYDREKANLDGKLALSWYQSLSLDPLLGVPGLNWQGAERVRELNARLRGFAGIASQKVPRGFGATLRPYQQTGYDWLQFLREFGFQGILADDMGLGKTIQTLAHLLKEKQSKRANLPSLVVAPTSVVPNWRREAARFAPSLRVLVVQGPEREHLLKTMADYDLILTTYTLLRIDIETYEAQAFHQVILDEAQAIKNPASKTAKTVCRLQARHRLALSGTPMENHLNELWSIYRFLMPGFLGSQESFNRLYRTPIEKFNDRSRAEALRNRVRPFLLRRTKTEVEKDLPPKTEIIQYLELSGAQRDLYETIRVAMDARVKAEIGKKGLKRSQIMILEALLKLRQACCDPGLLKLEQARETRESAKLEWLLETVPEMVEEGRRILIFSQFVSMLDLIEAGLKTHRLAPLRLTGATQDREQVVEAFQQGESPVFLISLKAGGVGINLTAADTVIHYDPWWNPAAENQATDRAWRIGQDKPVFVYKLICEQTVEEKILALQQKKAQLSEGIFSDQGEGAMRLDAEELLALLEE